MMQSGPPGTERTGTMTGELRDHRLRLWVVVLLVYLLMLLGVRDSGAAAAGRAAEAGIEDLRTRFLTFCDLAAAELFKEITRFADRENADPATHHMPFFEDAHAVRALAVAYDMTGERKFLNSVKEFARFVIGELSARGAPSAGFGEVARGGGTLCGRYCILF